MILIRRTFGSLLVASFAIAFAGCAATDLRLPWDDDISHDSKRNPVVRIVTLWQPAEGRDPDNRPCRGFAGQLLFLGNKGGLPIAIDGDLRFYVFDDQGSLEDQAKPISQIDFLEGTFSRQLKVDMLGASYHVFIPYERQGMNSAKCTVMVRYTARDREPVFSEVATVYLKGKKDNVSSPADRDAPLIFHTNAPPEPLQSGHSTRIPFPTSPSEMQHAEVEQRQRIESILKDFAHEQSARQQLESSDDQPDPAGSPRIRWNTPSADEAGSLNPPSE